MLKIFPVLLQYFLSGHRYGRVSACFVFAVLVFSAGYAQQTIDLIRNNRSDYSIILSEEPTKEERRAADILQEHILKATKVKLPIVTESQETKHGIYLGNTERYTVSEYVRDEGCILKTDGDDIIISGRNGAGVIYGVTTFLERYAGCYKPDVGAVETREQRNISIPADLNVTSEPSFLYREAHYPYSEDDNYMQWHALNRLEDMWGVWGHSFERLMPADTHFGKHPEYFALVNGKRQPSQLCLSNEKVFDLIVKELKARMAKHRDAMYWSIAPNDNTGYCRCDRCKKVDIEEDSPSGSLIRFMNRVAGVFPDKRFTTLAYTYTIKPPRKAKPVSNVYIFLSNIEVYRDLPLATEPSAATFLQHLKQWAAVTDNIFIWDYATQFTNYLAPFPNLHTLQDNFRLYKDHHVKGVFVQGSGSTYSDFAELRSHVYAKLLWNVNTDVEREVAAFISRYYGPRLRRCQSI
ncbi:MAG: DUF4838 domain-containing protein [Sphingobacteriales bacterium]|nr:MAG: DUF4838 domain-containing protein [Sphingobacteriales bacterium]